MKGNYYTYKITFDDLPKYFYFGFHRHRNDADSYLGSPVTWKRFWNQFEPRVQILQWFETEEEARNCEKSIIKSTWKNSYSLNENCGGNISQESMKKIHEEKNEEGKSLHAARMGGLAAAANKRNQTGFFDSEVQSDLGKRGSKKCKELGVGCFFDGELKKEINEKLKEEGRGIYCPGVGEKGRETQRKLGVGFFNPDAGSKGRERQKELQVGFHDPEKREKYRKRATEAVSKSVTCENTETGEIITFSSVSSAHRETGVNRHRISRMMDTNEVFQGLIFTTSVRGGQ